MPDDFSIFPDFLRPGYVPPKSGFSHIKRMIFIVLIVLSGFLLVTAIPAFWYASRHQEFWNLLGHTWDNLLAALSSSTLQVVVFSLTVPFLIILGFFIYNFLQAKHTGESTRDVIKKTLWPTVISAGITLAAWIILFSAFSVKTIYMDHESLKLANQKLMQENDKLKHTAPAVQIQYVPQEPPKEPASSLRLRTLKVVNDLTLFWSRRPLPLQPVQNPSTDEERQRNAKWDAYWHEANAAYINAGFRERILGIVRQYKAKGVDIGFLEQVAEQPERTWGAMAYGGTDCSRYQGSELCQLHELAYHVDANDNAIVLTLEGSK